MNFETIQNGAITHLRLEEARLDAAQAIPFKEIVRGIADDGANYKIGRASGRERVCR